MRDTVSRRTVLGCFAAAIALPKIGSAAPGSGGKEVPWLAEVQRPPQSLPADAPRLAPVLVDRAGRPIRELAAWESRRHEIRRAWLDFLGPMTIARTPPPKLTVLEEDRPEGAVRRLVRYEVEPGLPTEAYLLLPARPAQACPGAVVFHQTTTQTIRESAGLGGNATLAFALALARRGFVAFCPRNYLWPKIVGPHSGKAGVAELQARHPRAKGMAKMLCDALLAVDILVAQPGVDPQRIAAVGHSLGAKEVLYLAALDPRVRTTVSSEGGIGTRFSNWEAPWYLGPDIRQPSFTHEHHELLALVAPRAFLLLGGDSADGARSWPFVASALDVYRLYGGPARVGLYNHKQGHSVPPDAQQRLYEWIETYC